ncbi:hypothetical protein KPL78_18360 [Roseomonas sp. HJA6]|uniref:Argininosuccinate lyase n=1 Tax=Roseomonas alba TaxID=2846776 RepID=A0ABS7AC14_9PROT|nr:hypothetical protein [Neoroseomonas alba]MBW6399828.1 hypothetical protein [Neoroseomonas alba]
MKLAVAGLLLAAALIAGCRDTAPAPDATRPGSLSVSVGGSVGMAGAAISQSR